jgi:hypothetical protein
MYVLRNLFVICTTLKPDISVSRNQAVTCRKKGVQARIDAISRLSNPLGETTDFVIDLVSARRRHGALIPRLSYLGHHSWRTDGINASRRLNPAEKIHIPDMLEGKLCLISRSSIENNRKQ